MFRKALAKKITTVITAAVLTVMAVVPAMAAGKPDKGTIYPVGSITSAKSHELASRVTMSRVNIHIQHYIFLAGKMIMRRCLAQQKK